MAIAVLAVLIIWHYSGRESTDDAQLEGHVTQISAQVGGHIVEVAVRDNEFVDAGRVLVRIDPRDYQAAVDRARAELADAKATAAAAGIGVPIAEISTTSDVTSAAGGVEDARAAVAAAEAQIDAARAELVAAEARVREKEAAATRTARDIERLEPLVEKDEIPRQQFDAAIAAAEAARAAADASRSEVVAARTAVAVAERRARQARAGTTRAQAALQASQTGPRELEISKAKAASAEARVKQAEAALAQASLNLERTTICAPAAGIVSRKVVERGQVVQPAQPLLAVVPLDDVWVVASYKETQLRNIRTGQRAVVEVDALGRELTGHVDSIGAATGAKFSLLPPENATGNYVKVVQRVPVKIVFDPGQDSGHLLRLGMSVVPTVFTKQRQ
jgi:membrane fusion protein, multidrug efflux system